MNNGPESALISTSDQVVSVKEVRYLWAPCRLTESKSSIRCNELAGINDAQPPPHITMTLSKLLYVVLYLLYDLVDPPWRVLHFAAFRLRLHSQLLQCLQEWSNKNCCHLLISLEIVNYHNPHYHIISRPIPSFMINYTQIFYSCFYNLLALTLTLSFCTC